MNEKDFKTIDGYLLTGVFGETREEKGTIEIPSYICGLRKYCLSNLVCDTIHFPKYCNNIIYRGTIYNDPNLKTVIFDGDLNIIDKYFAENCENLSDVIITNRYSPLKSINGCVYDLKHNLTFVPQGKEGELIVEEGATDMDLKIFLDCPRLTSIVLPHSLKHLTLCDMTSLKNLKTITFQENVQISNPDWLQNWKGPDFIINEENPYMCYKDGTFYIGKERNYIIYIHPNVSGDYVIPSNTTKIDKEVFKNTNITGIIIPENINFSDIVYWGNRKQKDAHDLFYSCKNLKKLIFKNKHEQIPAHSLYGRMQESTPYLYPSQLSDSTISNNISDYVQEIINDETVEVEEDWLNDWFTYYDKNMDHFFVSTLRHTKFLKKMIDRNCLSAKNIDLLLSKANPKRDVESVGLLLEYKNIHFSADDLMDLKKKEFEQDLENALKYSPIM